MSETEISTEPGTIYFIRERNLITNEISPFVKIGLTALQRKTADRKNELQTGNPRELFVAHEVKVSCVKAVETALRYKFLMQNVNLEWHVFSDKTIDQLKDALAYCEELSMRFEENINLIEKAKNLSNTFSFGNLVPKTNKAAYWCQQYLVNQEILKLGKSVAIVQRAKAKAYFKDDRPLPDGISINERTVSEVDWNQFEELYPEIVKNYTSRPQVGIFKMLKKLTKREITDSAEILRAKVEVDKFFELYSAENNLEDPSPALRQQQIKVQQLVKFSSVEKELACCQLKVLCGTAPGIVDTCSWVRKLGEPRLDIARLTRENQNLLPPFTTNKKLVVATLKRSAGRLAERSEIDNQ